MPGRQLHACRVTPVWFVRARVSVCVYICSMYVFDNIVYDAGDDGRFTPGRGYNNPAHSRPLPFV